MRGLWTVLLVLNVLLAGCGLVSGGWLPGGTACTELYAYGVSVTVTRSTDGAPIGNATLTLTDGSYTEVMQPFPTGDYVGAGERAGTYTLTASAPGFESQTVNNIVVTADVCHVQGVHLSLELKPQS